MDTLIIIIPFRRVKAPAIQADKGTGEWVVFRRKANVAVHRTAEQTFGEVPKLYFYPLEK